MTLTITPAGLSGRVVPPPSKSQAHRFLIAAALAEGVSRVSNVALSQDIRATLACLEELGAEIALEGDVAQVRGMGANAMSPLRRMALPRLDCGESGSTLRFLIPLALAVRGGGVFTGRGRLMERPQGPYEVLLADKGIAWTRGAGTLSVQGRLAPGRYALPGDVSSQFFTGLLYALPLLDGPSVLLPTSPLESEGYVRLTLDALARFGVEFPAALSLPPQWHIPGGLTYRPAQVAVEADWSQAAFWYVAQALGSPVEVAGMDPASLQGDGVILSLLDTLARPGDAALDVSQCPDLVPPLAAMAALRPGGTTRLERAGRLRMKESDRLSAVAAALNALGGQVTEGEDFLEFHGVDALAGGAADARNDHRIAMMVAVAATRSRGDVTLTGAESVAKSYPDFWQEYQRLGGKLTWST